MPAIPGTVHTGGGQSEEVENVNGGEGDDGVQNMRGENQRMGQETRRTDSSHERQRGMGGADGTDLMVGEGMTCYKREEGYGETINTARMSSQRRH